VLIEAKMSTQDAINLFSKFGVPDAGSLSKINLLKAYRKLATQHHPDVGGKTEDMQDISYAYEILKKSSSGSSSRGSYSRRHTNSIEEFLIYAFRNLSLNILPPLDDEEKGIVKQVVEKLINCPHLDDYEKEDLEKVSARLNNTTISDRSDMSRLMADIENEITGIEMYYNALLKIREIMRHDYKKIMDYLISS
jgi:hypothetical protein